MDGPSAQFAITLAQLNPTVGDIVGNAGKARAARAQGKSDGADLVVHSLTKYINGHGDAMGGAVIGRADLIDPIKGDAMVDVGGVISPFNAWMIQRGSVTLPLRLRQHFASAQRVAEMLEADPRVAFVAYPGLASHPQHEVAARQFGGREFGAETMAVAGEMMAQSRKIAGVILVDPGPTAFFEVEPPALALRPTSPSDWSTRAAVTRLERPTLCVTHAAAAGSLLCHSLAGRGQATSAETGASAAVLANTIAGFILRR